MFDDFVFHHVGIATNCIAATAAFYIEVGYTTSSMIEDPIQDVKICFLTKENSPLIELVSPISAESPVRKIVEKSGVTPYHTCYEVKDIFKSIDLLKKRKFIPLSKPVPAVAIESRLICFLYHKDFGLLELLQSS